MFSMYRVAFLDLYETTRKMISYLAPRDDVEICLINEPLGLEQRLQLLKDEYTQDEKDFTFTYPKEDILLFKKNKIKLLKEPDIGKIIPKDYGVDTVVCSIPIGRDPYIKEVVRLILNGAEKAFIIQNFEQGQMWMYNYELKNSGRFKSKSKLLINPQQIIKSFPYKPDRRLSVIVNGNSDEAFHFVENSYNQKSYKVDYFGRFIPRKDLLVVDPEQLFFGANKLSSKYDCLIDFSKEEAENKVKLMQFCRQKEIPKFISFEEGKLTEYKIPRKNENLKVRSISFDQGFSNPFYRDLFSSFLSKNEKFKQSATLNARKTLIQEGR